MLIPFFKFFNFEEPPATEQSSLICYKEVWVSYFKLTENISLQ